jgi:A/G-specific adenine glycosylase
VAARLRAEPAALLPAARHEDWNQAAMELGARVCTARAPRCGECPAAAWCPSRGRVEAAPRRAQPPAARFEETDRWARGRVVAALAAGDEPARLMAPDRLERVLASLVRDGLVERDGTRVGLPGAPR